MQNNLFTKGLFFGIIVMFIGVTFSSSIASNINKLAIDSSRNLSYELSEKEIFEQKYKNNPIKYRFLSQDGGIHIVTKSKSELMNERAQNYEKDNPLIISNNKFDGNHLPIYIEGNDGFTPDNGVTGGSGTENNPYIIENWIIVDDGSTENGIFVSNTDVYFIIRNCTIEGFSGDAYSGIWFSNVKNGGIDDSDCFENYYGIIIKDSSYITINNSIFHDNYGWYATGILCSDSSYITITSCECYNMRGPADGVPTGIVLDESSYCLVEDTSCYKNKCQGIRIEAIKRNPCEYNTIKNCKIYNNLWDGIYISRIGVYLPPPGYHHIIGCEIYDNGHAPGLSNALPGITIYNFHNNIVEDCNIYGNGEGVIVADCSNNIIRNCSIHDHWMPGFLAPGVSIEGYEVTLDFAINNIIEHCDIYNQDVGIDITEAFRAKVYKNNIYDNSFHGIEIFNFLGISTAYVKNNNIYGNGFDGTEWACGLIGFTVSIVDAKNNWWGSEKGPSSDLFPNRGDKLIRWFSWVSVRPWATEPIPDGGVQ